MKKAYLYGFICILVIFLFIFAFVYKKEPPTLKIYILNVGQGDSIYIKTPSGQDMLIDAGRDRSVLAEISKYTNSDNSIETLHISNPDLDHIGGFPFIIEEYKVANIISPGTNHENLEAFKEIERLIEQKQIPVIKPKQGDTIILDQENSITYTILWPEGNVENWERNSGSIVGLLEYGNKKILFTGDAPKEVEDEVLKKYGKYLQNIDILKVGHHGSDTSTGENLVKIARPKYALISAGLNNRYGHPKESVLETLQKYSAVVLTTIDNGTIVCSITLNAETICK